MKRKILLPILLLSAFVLGGCNSQKKSETSQSEASSSDTTQYGVEIANKEALEGEWYAGDNKDLDLTLTPEANPLMVLNKGLTITSSDETVVKVSGLGLAALKAGTVTITVDYHGAKDTANVTILAADAKAKYGASHFGTAEDPFTNEDALLVAKHAKYGGEKYYVRGEIEAWYHEPLEQHKDGTCFYFKPAQVGGERFEVYKLFKEDGSKLADGDVWLTGIATVVGAFTKYNSQYETSSAVFVSCTGGTKPGARTTVEKTFAEVLALNNSLADGSNSYDYIKFQGYVSAKSGNDYFLTATKGEALVKEKSDKDHGEKDYYSNAFQMYGATAEGLKEKLLDGAKVEVTTIVKNYHGQAENLLAFANDDVVVKEAGEQWKVPEPAVAEKTLAEFLEVTNDKKHAYLVKATIKAFKDGETKDDYGNMTLTDGTNDLVIYGSSATATALAWDNSDSYAFTNPKDFQTNATTSALKINDVVVMKLVRNDYKETKQGQGIIVDVNPKEYTKLEKFAFHSDLTGYKAYNAEEMQAFLVAASDLGANTNYVSHSIEGTGTNPLIGAGGGKKDAGEDWANYNLLKLGSTSKNAKIALTFKEGTKISKIEMKAFGWEGLTCKMQVNDGAAADIASVTHKNVKAGIDTGACYSTYSFTFDATNVITLQSTLAVMIGEITFYTVAE